MADTAKYTPINGGTPFVSDFKSLSSFVKRRKTVAFFMFAFVGFTVFLAFSPSSNSSSPWFTNIFSTSSSSSSATVSADSYRSQFSSVFDFLFPNSSSSSSSSFQGLNFTSYSNSTRSNNSVPQLPNAKEVQNFTKSLNTDKEVVGSKNTTVQSPSTNKNNTQSSVLQANQTTVSPPSLGEVPPSASKQTGKEENSDKAQVLKANQTTIATEKAPRAANHTTIAPPAANHATIAQTAANKSTSSPPKSGPSKELSSGKGEKTAKEKGLVSNYTSSLSKNEKNQSGGIENLIETLMNCDLFDGVWVRDDSYPLYKPGSCSFIDEQFSCVINGRPDTDFQKLKWKPNGCNLPRLNGAHMLELLRGKRLVFVGDSLNRNMWESLVCILKGAAKNPNNVYEAHGRQYFRGEASYSFVFKDYKCTLDFFVSPFLVREWEMPDKNGKKKETLRLDLVGKSSDQYKAADIIIFNTGHWWTHDKTSKGKDYYQEGSHVYNELNVLEAFRKALTTWARWVDANVNPTKSMVFFRGYSQSHFSGGQWNSGGACDSEVEPIRNETFLRRYPPKMLVLEKVLKNMKTHVTYLNITQLTDFRKDGHPSIYRKHPKQKLSEDEKIAPLKYQDCSHWCLPGVPDAWNELLYAELLVKENKMRQHQRKAR